MRNWSDVDKKTWQYLIETFHSAGIIDKCFGSFNDSTTRTIWLGSSVHEGFLRIIFERTDNITLEEDGSTVLEKEESTDDLIELNLSLAGEQIRASDMNKDKPIWKRNGILDILIHPTYLIPCPYLQISNEKGKLEPYESRSEKWVQEEHPILGTPCSTLHLCNLERRLEILSVAGTNGFSPYPAFLQFLSCLGQILGYTPVSRRLGSIMLEAEKQNWFRGLTGGDSNREDPVKSFEESPVKKMSL